MSFEDIIPIDALLGKKTQAKFEDNTPVSNGKEKLTAKLCSLQLCEFPNGCEVSRDLIDIGIREIYELEGRSAESLFDEIKDLKPRHLNIISLLTHRDLLC